jgi:hypothetical protein
MGGGGGYEEGHFRKLSKEKSIKYRRKEQKLNL